MDYLKDSPPVIRDYLVYLETIMGRSPRTVNEYYLDLRTFFRYILQSRSLVPSSLEFDQITLEKVDLTLIKSVTRAEILDFLVFAARQRPKHHKSRACNTGKHTLHLCRAQKPAHRLYRKILGLRDNRSSRSRADSRCFGQCYLLNHRNPYRYLRTG